MRFAFWPSNAISWDDLLALCQHAEQTGWDGLYYADHFMPNRQDNSGPTNECWTTIAALAASVPRVRIGPLVSGNTYRHPAVLAKMAATVDNISGGRLVLGLGAGWQENEHEAYGIDYSTVMGRLAMLEEACHVIKGLFNNERTDFEGTFYQLKDAPLAPKPVGPVPMLIGGGGEKRTMRIAAECADEWNTWATPDLIRHKNGVLDSHCQDIGRDPKEIKRSCQAITVVTDDPSVAERARGTGFASIAGTVDEIKSIMNDYVEAGVDEFIFPGFALPREVAAAKEVLDTFINEVAADFR